MNCRPGDLAVVVSLDAGSVQGSECQGVKADLQMVAIDIRGAIFKCVRLEGEEWVVEPRRVKWMGVMNDGRNVSGEGDISRVPDRVLKPLRDPGDDAVDESNAWLPPVPALEHA
jgi:hypothetical protein